MPQILQKRRRSGSVKRPSVSSPSSASSLSGVPGAGWTLRRTSAIPVLTAESLSALSWLVHGFSTRPGGASTLNGDRVLNLGFTEWDSRAAVAENRRRFLGGIGAENMALLTLRQIHSDLARVFDGPEAAPPKIELSAAAGAKSRNGKSKVAGATPLLKGDAVITGKAGLLASVQTADCVPILLVDRKRRVVAAVHAGWRGTLARVTQKSLGPDAGGVWNAAARCACGARSGHRALLLRGWAGSGDRVCGTICQRRGLVRWTVRTPRVWRRAESAAVAEYDAAWASAATADGAARFARGECVAVGRRGRSARKHYRERAVYRLPYRHVF